MRIKILKVFSKDGEVLSEAGLEKFKKNFYVLSGKPVDFLVVSNGEDEYSFETEEIDLPIQNKKE